jgi:antitoxin HicB
MKPFRYRIVVEWSDEDRAFLARVPALPGCAAHGKTAEDAAREARKAAAGMLDVLLDDGDDAPPEDAVADFSGKIHLRLPRSLHERLARLATAEDVSLNQVMVALLAEGCGRKAGTARRPRAGAARRGVRGGARKPGEAA